MGHKLSCIIIISKASYEVESFTCNNNNLRKKLFRCLGLTNYILLKIGLLNHFQPLFSLIFKNIIIKKSEYKY